jgi:hypothetical protein
VVGLDNEARGEARLTEAGDCVHVSPNTVDLPDLPLETSATWATDFAWFTAAKPCDGCALCELGCCMQRVSGDIGMEPGRCVVLHGVLGAA